MNVTRLAPWIARNRANATSWQLRFISGDNSHEIVRSWTEPELSDTSDRVFAELLLASAQDDCDVRELPDCRYRVVARSTDADIAGTVVKCRPSDAKPDPLDVGDVGSNTSIQQLVRMNEAMLRVIVSSFGSTIEGFRSLIATQQVEIAELRKREQTIAHLYEKSLLAQMDEEPTNHALTKLVELGEKIGPTILNEIIKKGAPAQ